MAKKKNKEKNKEQPKANPRMVQLQALYDGGNFASIHHKAPALLAEEGLSDTDQNQAQDLLSRVKIDAVAIYVGLGSLAFISLVALLTLSAK
ncbi:MAG: hypothetical protein CMH56_08485 [Myxococcales bacterium]|nr:hypothetical protein [Myxococcales bacterium]|tara:strand:- start:169 stop:444 length:276 start_codon:yes stop_codon:yes gene_type:complete